MTRWITNWVVCGGLVAGVLLPGCASTPDGPTTTDAAPSPVEEHAAASQTVPSSQAVEPAETEPAPLLQAPVASERGVSDPVSSEQSVPTSSSKAVADVLEEVTDSDVVGSPGKSSADVAGSPEYQALRGRLRELGYEGVGLEHEPRSVLILLTGVFSHPDLAKRRIKRVYTGGGMEYDTHAEAITIGGLKSKSKILNFIRKKVPRR